MRRSIVKNLNVKTFFGALKRKYFISTPIFYVNASPHIGHLYSAVIADAVNRFQAITLTENVIFSTGTDEHGLKVELAAKKDHLNHNKNGKFSTSRNTLDYCNRISSEFSSLFKKCNVNYSDFVRTTEPRHLSTVNKLWQRILKNGHIYEGSYTGWYCISDEAFLKQSQLKEVKVESGNGTKTVMLSVESGQPAEWTEEKNYIFKMSSFKDELLYWLKDEKVVRPTKFYHILRTIIEEVSLGDLSISRPSERIPWGIPVPGDPSQSIYVWVDALGNYLTAANVFSEESDELNLNNWPPDLQVIGKDILKFHGIYWPSLLIAAGLEPPKSLLVHSHWTVNGEKMSKSRGNVVDPFDRSDKYTPDGLRYFLLREGVAHSDGRFKVTQVFKNYSPHLYNLDYSDGKVIKILNAELADTFGNLLNRCTGSSLNPHQEFPSLTQEDVRNLCSKTDEIQSETTQRLVDCLMSLPDRTKSYYSNQEFNRVVDSVMDALRSTNKFFESHRPWDAAKQLRKISVDKTVSNDPSASNIQNELKAIISLSLESLRVCGLIMQPIIPTLSCTLLDTLGIPESKRMWTDATRFSWEGNGKECSMLKPGKKVPLFKRIILAEGS